MNYVILELQKNKQIFLGLLKDIHPEMARWSQAKEKWDLLHIVCHLYDEERDDFRFRVKWLLDKPGETPPPFNPIDWVTEHNYKKQDYYLMLSKFVEEREKSITWLQSLKNPNCNNSFEHSKLGHLTAKYFFDNWLAHDYLHIKQIIKLKFNYLEYKSGSNLNYSGTW